MTWRLSVNGALLIMLILGGITGCYVMEMRAAQRIVPPDHVIDVPTFLAWRPQTLHFVRVQSREHHAHIMATGAHRPLSSGPSAYVFNQTGRLVDWTRDIGDNQTFDQRWNAQQSLQSSETVTRDEARSWADSNAAVDQSE